MEEQTQVRKGTETHIAEREENGNGLHKKIVSYLPEIISVVSGIDTDQEISIQGFSLNTVRTGWASPVFLSGTTEFYRKGYSTITQPEKVGFFIKLFPQAASFGATDPLKRELQLYSIMEGSGVTPRAFQIPGLDRMLILEHGGNATSETKLTTMSNGRREGVEDIILRTIARFNLHGERQTVTALDNSVVGPELREKKPSLEKAARYFEGYLKACGLESDSKDIDDFSNCYLSVAEMYSIENHQLIHADMRRQNILGPSDNPWTEDNIKIIDMDMCLGDPIFPVAQFITSAGAKADAKRWNTKLERYMRHEASLRGVIGGQGIRHTMDALKQARQKFYPVANFYALKGLNKMARKRAEEPEQYQRLLHERPVLFNHDNGMKLCLRVSLGYLEKNPEDFDLTASDITAIKRLGEIFQKYKMISSLQ